MPQVSSQRRQRGAKPCCAATHRYATRLAADGAAKQRGYHDGSAGDRVRTSGAAREGAKPKHASRQTAVQYILTRHTIQVYRCTVDGGGSGAPEIPGSDKVFSKKNNESKSLSLSLLVFYQKNAIDPRACPYGSDPPRHTCTRTMPAVPRSSEMLV